MRQERKEKEEEEEEEEEEEISVRFQVIDETTSNSDRDLMQQ